MTIVLPAGVPRVARKTVTTIQEGSVYKDRFILPGAPRAGSTVRAEFLDSAGSVVANISGDIDGRYLLFRSPYADVAEVPNGAGFTVYVHVQGEDEDDEHLVFYGSVFRRQLTFPTSPGTSVSTVVRQFTDTFQRPSGRVGGRWKTLIGKPHIFDNTEWFGLGEDHPNTVGPEFNFFSRYYMYYYVPFNSDSCVVSISASRKGPGTTIVSLCGSNDGSSYLYAGLKRTLGGANTVEVGYGTSPDINIIGAEASALHPQVTPASLTVPGNTGMGNYKIQYNASTKAIGFYNNDMTTKYVEWVDDDDIVAHGKGYRYFGIGGNCGIFDGGIQLAYIHAQDTV